MSFRLACLLSAAVLGAGLAPPVLAKAKHATHASHHAKKEAAASKAPALIWRGDVTTAHGVAGDMAQAWAKTGHGPIEVQTFNTASGLDAVRTGAADMAGSARGSSGDANEATLSFNPVAWDGLVMVTHPANPVNNLTLQQLHDIYLGKITNWAQVGGNNEPIDLYAVASPGDGVEYSLRRLLFGHGSQPVAAPRLYLNTVKLEEGIRLDPKGLGVTTLANVTDDHKVKMISINGVAPSVSSLSNGSYLLFTQLYVVTNAASPKAAESQAFVDFLNSEAAKAVMRRHSIVPYSDGTRLTAMDSSRRAGILAQVGARAVPDTVASAPVSRPPPLSVPGPVAGRPVATPASVRTQALDERKARDDAAAAAKLAEADKPSLDGVNGDAITVENAPRDGSFAKVSSIAYAPPLIHAGKIGNNQAGTRILASNKTYKVSSGDTLYSIARKHAIDVADLRGWNHLANDQVKPGQLLRISAR